MKVLFLCTGNSCRSQMAEGFGRALMAKGHRVFSAGTDPQGINPRTIVSMAECGIDIAEQESNNVNEIPISELDLVVSMCGHAQENYPDELADVEHIHWPLPDPADASGDEEEIMRSFAEIRNDIRNRVEELLNS
ncbi:MAG: arsenate reductase [Planctomycetota bacterium]|jgi:arsenate reductase